MGLKILITNNTLASRAGTELYVRDIAVALLRRGHTPIAYSTLLGEVAQELRRATVPVIDHLDALATPPDIIHGHHHLETMTALLKFPGVPAISFCHGWNPWEEAPPKFPRIRRYIAVDEACRDRLVHENGIPDAAVRLLPNFVDLNRFKPRNSLPDRPARALVFSNYVTERGLGPIQEACFRAGIEVDAVGSGLGKPTSRPEDVLPKYDLVFAQGRSAIEALAVGTAVILWNTRGAGSMVTTGNIERLRRLNFGIRTIQGATDSENVSQEIARYNAFDAMQASSWIRRTAGLDDALDRLLDLYNEVLEDYHRYRMDDNRAEIRAASDYLRQWVPNLTAQQEARMRHEALRVECDALRSELDALRRENHNVARVYSSPTLRLRNRLVAIPLLGPVLRSCARFVAGRMS
jgi:glycosyltransferase involved in cell wall biosynthesis